MALAIRIQSLTKSYSRTQALKAVDLQIGEGEMVALIGPSGSGKSTLLRHIAGLEVADRLAAQGRIDIGTEWIQNEGRLSRQARATRANIGFIFQQFNLINRLPVVTNVLLGALGRIPRWRGSLAFFSRQEKLQALQALERVGLKTLAMQRASTLSGGQQQRVAIAKTLMQQAEVILADEPIASLDPKSARTVMQHLHALCQEDGKTVVVTLHQVDYARQFCQRAVALVNGEIAFDGPVSELTDEVLHELYGTAMSEVLVAPDSIKAPPHPEPTTALANAIAG